MKSLHGYLAFLSTLLLAAASLQAQTWVTQTSGVTEALNSVYFVDQSNGYIVGNNGSVFKTTDGGAHWVSVLSTQQLFSVHFTDVNTGYAVGNSGTIIKTTNGGANWTTQTSNTYFTLNGVGCASASVCFAVGAVRTSITNLSSPTALVTTTNGGATWTVQANGLANKFLYAVDFADANNGYAVGDSGSILKTTNSGTSWTPQTSGTTFKLTSVKAVNASVAYAVGYNATTLIPVALKTTNGGTTWAQLTTNIPTLGLFDGVSFSDANNGYISSSNYVLKTTDGGSTWINTANPTGVSTLSIFTPSTGLVYAVGNNGTILKSGTSTAISFSPSSANRVEVGKNGILRYSLAQSVNVRIVVSDANGKLTQVMNASKSAGNYSQPLFNEKNLGVRFVDFRAGNQHQILKFFR